MSFMNHYILIDKQIVCLSLYLALSLSGVEILKHRGNGGISPFLHNSIAMSFRFWIFVFSHLAHDYIIQYRYANRTKNILYAII